MYYADGKNTEFHNILTVTTTGGLRTRIIGYISGADRHGLLYIWRKDGDSTRPLMLNANLGDLGAAAPSGHGTTTPQHIEPRHGGNGKQANHGGN